MSCGTIEARTGTGTGSVSARACCGPPTTTQTGYDGSGSFSSYIGGAAYGPMSGGGGGGGGGFAFGTAPGGGQGPEPSSGNGLFGDRFGSQHEALSAYRKTSVLKSPTWYTGSTAPDSGFLVTDGGYSVGEGVPDIDP